MSGDATVTTRILRALDTGPLYEGLIPLIVNTTPTHVRRILRHLEVMRHVVRDENGTWRKS